MKNWVIFLPWELDFEMKCEFFKKDTFKFWTKNAGKLRFLLEFWVIFLSFRFLELWCPWVFFGGAQRKAWAKLWLNVHWIYSRQLMNIKVHVPVFKIEVVCGSSVGEVRRGFWVVPQTALQGSDDLIWKQNVNLMIRVQLT